MYGCQLRRFVCLILLSISVYVQISVASSNICFMCLLLFPTSTYIRMSVASFCVSNIAVNICVCTDVSCIVLCVYYCCLSVYVLMSVESSNICFMYLLLLSISSFVASFCVSNIAVNICVCTDVS